MEQSIRLIRNSLQDIYPPGEINALIRIIFEEVCQYSLTDILLHKNSVLSANKRQEVETILQRLVQHEPIQYILGHTTFYGIDILVTPHVLIPRPETEELVELVLKENSQTSGNILDVGTGSGCIALALAKHLPEAQVEGWDISPEALNTAIRNAQRNGIDVSFSLQDILTVDAGKIPNRYELIVSNPPYICEQEKKDMDKNVLDYEPHLALFVTDDDPLIFYRKIAEAGKQMLKPGGKLYFEINALLGEETSRMIERHGYSDIRIENDISGKPRFISAKKE